jgi:transketolase
MHELDNYKEIAKDIRREILDMIYRTRSPHIGSSFSSVELLVGLYQEILCVSPDNPSASNRDRFLLSKGHACAALYAVLGYKGFISKDTLSGFAVNGGTLEHHPTKDLSLGIELTTGSLGHALSVGAGMAIAAKYDKRFYRIFILLSDGELNEGDIYEAAMFASHHKLDNLIAIIDYNKIQAMGRTEEVLDLEPLVGKWRTFGWEVREIDGHNFEQIIENLKNVPFEKGRPNMVIAHTLKGKGVSFMEDKLLWHYRCPNEEEYERAVKELS